MWKTKQFQKQNCSGVLTNEGDDVILVEGQLRNGPTNAKVSYWAAAPATRGTSYYGSGHPFANPEMAYENTPNKGIVNTENGRFSFRINHPNAYYVRLGSVYVPPHLHIRVCDDKENCAEYFTVQISDGIPYRTLTYPAPPSLKPRAGPMFYKEPEREVRSQDTILFQSAYPGTMGMPDNFWGDKPPK